MNNKKIGILFCIQLILAIGLVCNGAAGQTKAPAKSPAKEQGPAPIDLNKATTEQLSKCPGLTSTLAKAIVEYRAQSGIFKTRQDLLKVKGMTKEILDRLNPKMDKGILYVTPVAPPSEEDEEEPSLKPSKC